MCRRIPTRVSPELMLRPSLSGLDRRCGAGRRFAVSPELMLRPSLSAPVCYRPRRRAKPVSPELMLRPSLSAQATGGAEEMSDVASVAGAYAPAFVERSRRRRGLRRAGQVSPELMLRPSLSVCQLRRGRPDRRRGVAGAYAPAFVERRSRAAVPRRASPSVAGAYAPAFVERRMWMWTELRTRPSVAGAYAPAFVERPPATATPRRISRVSPELMLRPSLSVHGSGA